jgi:hypothetical protein
MSDQKLRIFQRKHPTHPYTVCDKDGPLYHFESYGEAQAYIDKALTNFQPPPSNP